LLILPKLLHKNAEFFESIKADRKFTVILSICLCFKLKKRPFVPPTIYIVGSFTQIICSEGFLKFKVHLDHFHKNTGLKVNEISLKMSIFLNAIGKFQTLINRFYILGISLLSINLWFRAPCNLICNTFLHLEPPCSSLPLNQLAILTVIFWKCRTINNLNKTKILPCVMPTWRKSWWAFGSSSLAWNSFHDLLRKL
jgi:hypothetical protein